MQNKIIAGSLLTLSLTLGCSWKDNSPNQERDQIILSLVEQAIHPNYLAGGSLNWIEPQVFQNNINNPVFSQFPIKLRWNRHHSDPQSRVEIFCNGYRLFENSLVAGDLYLMDGTTYERHLKEALVPITPADRIALVPDQSQCEIKIFEANQKKTLVSSFRTALTQSEFN